MASQIDILEQKFYNDWRNRLISLINPNDYTRNLAASVGEEIRCVTTVLLTNTTSLVAPNNDPSQANFEIFPLTGGVYEIRSDEIEDWNDEDVWIGQQIFVALFATGLPSSSDWTGTVVATIGNRLKVQIGGPIPDPATISAIVIQVTEPFTAVKYTPNLVENEDSFTPRSLVSNNDGGFYAGGVGAENLGVRSTSFVDMIPLGEYNDWRTGKARVRFVEALNNGEQQKFEIEHTFVVTPLFLEGQTPLFDALRPPDYLAGDASLKYVQKIQIRQVLNNPNIATTKIEDELLGSVAWFNESFNGFDNEYEILSVNYKEAITNNSADGLLVNGRTVVTIEVQPKPSAPAYLSNSKFGIYFWYLPPENQYQDTKATDQKQNFIWDTLFGFPNPAFTFNGTGPIKTATMDLNGGVVTITFEVEFDAGEQTKITQGLQDGFNRFALGIQTGADERTDSGDKVTLLADAGTFDLSPDIPGLVTMEDLKIYPHNEDPDTEPGYTNMTSWNEDGLYFTFNLNLNLAKQAQFRSLSFVLVAVNPITGDSFLLNREDININQFSIDGNGVAQIELDSTRGYPLAEDSVFNFLKITTGTYTPGDSQIYEIQVGQKITWQDWIRNLDVPNVFVNAAEPNDNQNLKASNYSGGNGYVIRFGILANVFGVSDLGLSGLTDYLLTSNNLTINDYDKDGNDPPIFSATIQTFRASNMQETFGKVLSGEDTVMKITWVRADAPVTDLNQYWGIHRIEEFNQTGFQIYELSSLLDSAANNFLKPVSGESFLKKEIVGDDLVTTCLIDGTKITPGNTYNLSGRVGSTENPGGNFKTTSPTGNTKTTSGAGSTGKTLSTI